jgi:Tol biopolymer transport system component
MRWTTTIGTRYTVIDSDWNDFYPVVSPDKTKIAFISNRSGTNQVWIYYISNGNYKQITGYNTEDYLNEYWDRIEWLDYQHIFFTMHQSLLVKQKIE